MARRVWFEKCDCAGDDRPHGYLHVTSRKPVERCPVPTMSVEAGKALLDSVAKTDKLTPAEVEEVCAEFKAAGLPEKMDSDELMMLIDELGGSIGVAVIELS